MVRLRLLTAANKTVGISVYKRSKASTAAGSMVVV